MTSADDAETLLNFARSGLRRFPKSLVRFRLDGISELTEIDLFTSLVEERRRESTSLPDFDRVGVFRKSTRIEIVAGSQVQRETDVTDLRTPSGMGAKTRTGDRNPLRRVVWPERIVDSMPVLFSKNAEPTTGCGGAMLDIVEGSVECRDRIAREKWEREKVEMLMDETVVTVFEPAEGEERRRVAFECKFRHRFAVGGDDTEPFRSVEFILSRNAVQFALNESGGGGGKNGLVDLAAHVASTAAVACNVTAVIFRCGRFLSPAAGTIKTAIGSCRAIEPQLMSTTDLARLAENAQSGARSYFARPWFGGVSAVLFVETHGAFAVTASKLYPLTRPRGEDEKDEKDEKERKEGEWEALVGTVAVGEFDAEARSFLAYDVCVHASRNVRGLNLEDRLAIAQSATRAIASAGSGPGKVGVFGVRELVWRGGDDASALAAACLGDVDEASGRAALGVVFHSKACRGRRGRGRMQSARDDASLLWIPSDPALHTDFFFSVRVERRFGERGGSELRLYARDSRTQQRRKRFRDGARESEVDAFSGTVKHPCNGVSLAPAEMLVFDGDVVQFRLKRKTEANDKGRPPFRGGGGGGNCAAVEFEPVRVRDDLAGTAMVGAAARRLVDTILGAYPPAI